MRLKSGEEAIQNMVNGNLTDAKKLAKNVHSEVLMNRAREYGYRDPMAAAEYLKGVISFQKCCRRNDPPDSELDIMESKQLRQEDMD